MGFYLIKDVCGSGIKIILWCGNLVISVCFFKIVFSCYVSMFVNY